MAYDDQRAVSAKTMTALFDADTAGAWAVQNLGDYPVFLWATASGAGAPAPANPKGGVRLDPGVMAAEDDLTRLFPGVAAPEMLYGYCASATLLKVSHA